MNIQKLYDIAEKSDIIVNTRDMLPPSIAVDILGARAIALRKDLTNAEERSFLSHELGHHVKGALYQKETPGFTRGQCEHKANKWAVHKLMPFRSLHTAFLKGYTEVWEIAEYFEVTEEFVIKAIEIYKQEGKLPV